MDNSSPSKKSCGERTEGEATCSNPSCEHNPVNRRSLDRNDPEDEVPDVVNEMNRLEIESKSDEDKIKADSASSSVRYCVNDPKATPETDACIVEDQAAAPKEDEYVEGIVCQDSDIKENEMKSFELGDVGKVLVVRQNGKLSAIGNKCTHYGALLDTGVLGEGRVRCPWHGACFNIATGDIEDYPGLDSLPCYEVKVQDNNVKVRAKKADVQLNKRVKSMANACPQDKQHMVIIGGGPAGATCVEVLRQEGFTGKITMVAKENYYPYDRVKVSKTMDFEIDKAQFRTESFYKEHGIDVLKNTAAVRLDAKNNTVTLSNGNSLEYTKVFIATGCKPTRAEVPGAKLKQVVTLRNYDDAKFTLGMLNEDIDVVVLGASFIALEAASFCVGKVKSVTVIGRSPVPFKPLLGERIGAAIKTLFESKGVKFIMESGIAECIGDGNNNLTGVQLVGGPELKADICIMGVGSTFHTDFMENSGVEMRIDGSVECNEQMQTNIPNVYVGGDIAHAPVYSNNNEKSTIGHYPLAHYHGKMAALNMLDKNPKLEVVPFFWTMLFGKGFRYAGHGRYNDILYTGNVEELKFVAYYLKGDEVVAVSSCGMDPIVAKYAEHRSQGKKLHRQDLGDDLLGWSK